MSSRSPKRLHLESEILGRVIKPDASTLSPEAARSLVRLAFGRSDVTRMNALAKKNRAGKLTAADEADLESYLRVGRFLALVQAKARGSLQAGTRM